MEEARRRGGRRSGWRRIGRRNQSPIMSCSSHPPAAVAAAAAAAADWRWWGREEGREEGRRAGWRERRERGKEHRHRGQAPSRPTSDQRLPHTRPGAGRGPQLPHIRNLASTRRLRDGGKPGMDGWIDGWMDGWMDGEQELPRSPALQLLFHYRTIWHFVS